MRRRNTSALTLAEQRLNSAHGRLVYAAWRVPSRNRYLPSVPGRWAAIEVLAHIVEFRDEALRRLTVPNSEARRPRSDCAGGCTKGLRRHSWEELMESLEAGHIEVCLRLRSEPPAWFGQLTYEHFARHVPALEAWHASAARE